MKHLLFVLAMLFPLASLANDPEFIPVSYDKAISQSGRFSVKNGTQLVIDVDKTDTLVDFMAFMELETKKSLWIGGISGDESLQSICERPTFLIKEQIADVSVIQKTDIDYFKRALYSGCQIKINNNLSALIIVRPEPFINPFGQTIKYVGIVAPESSLSNLESNISFQITATDFFMNLLQISQAFSPFTHEQNWNKIRQEGLDWIGNNTEVCKGLSAAATFLLPALKQYDSHSSISMKGLGTASCPTPPLPTDSDMQKWFSLPTTIRTSILQYTADFHGEVLKGNVSYLYIPSIEELDSESVNKVVQTGRAALARANNSTNCGLIVDLRFNMGGNVTPMLLTLGGVLPAGNLFGLGKNQPVTLQENGNTVLPYGTYQGAPPVFTRDKPVAVITNWMTNSSGQLTRLALRDAMPIVKVFGTTTGPSASVNVTLNLLDGNVLNLMVDRIYNTHGEIVPLRLPVDEETEDDLQTVFQYEKDVSILVAADWLRSLPACQSSADG